MSVASTTFKIALLAAPLALAPMARADVRTSNLHRLGQVEVRFGANPNLEATAVRASRAAISGLNDSQNNGLQLKPVGTGTLEYNGTRYLYASFRVRNADENGKAYTKSNADLVLIASGFWGPKGTIAGTAVSRIARADGSDYGDDPRLQKTLARAIQPAHAMMLDGGRLVPIPGAADFVAFTEDEVNPKNFTPPSTLEGLESSTIFPYGYAVRCVTNCGSNPRALRANPAPDQFDGAVTVAVKLPAQPNPKDNPASFSLRLEVLGGNPARVTVSPEEGLNLDPALGRARSSGAKAILAIGSGQRSLSPEAYRALSGTVFSRAGGFQGLTNLRTANPDPSPAPDDPSGFGQTVTLLPNPQDAPTFSIPR